MLNCIFTFTGRGQENNENGLLSSKFNKFNPDGSLSSGRGYPSLSLFTTSSEHEPPPGGSPLFSFPPGGFRLFRGGGPSTLPSLFSRDCNCKLIHECSTFFGGASRSFRIRRTCGFEGFQRKVNAHLLPNDCNYLLFVMTSFYIMCADL